MNTAAQNYIQLKNYLEDLKLYQMEAHLDNVLELMDSKQLSVTEGLYRLFKLEMEAKKERAVNSCVKVAGFPFLKTFEDFDFSFQPVINKQEILAFKDMRFIESATNIIFIGSPGVGKTHLSVSIGIESAKNRKSTYFIKCHDLLSQLMKAKNENRLEERIKHFNKYKVLIVDEIGFLPFEKEAGNLLFQLLEKRYEKKPTIITTNVSLSKWGELFGDPVVANAILDRLLHHSKVIKIVGKSYRTKDVDDFIPKKAANENGMRSIPTKTIEEV